MPKTRTAVIIVSWGKPELTRATFESLIENTSTDWSLFWMQNEWSRGSEENKKTAEYLWSKDVKVRIETFDKNMGFAVAVNKGIRSALRDPHVTHIALLNNDVVVPPQWDSRLISQLVLSEVDAIGTLSDDDTVHGVDLEETDYASYDRHLLESLPWQTEDTVWRTPALAFFCTMFPRKTIETVGYLEEEFGLAYAEDSDYCMRMRNENMTLGIAKSVLVHHESGGSTSRKENLALRRHAYRKYVQKWGQDVIDNQPSF